MTTFDFDREYIRNESTYQQVRQLALGRPHPPQTKLNKPGKNLDLQHFPHVRFDLSTTHWKFFDLMHRLATNRAFVQKNVKKRIKFLQRSACHTKTPDGIFSKVTFLKSAIFLESLHRRK